MSEHTSSASVPPIPPYLDAVIDVEWKDSYEQWWRRGKVVGWDSKVRKHEVLYDNEPDLPPVSECFWGARACRFRFAGMIQPLFITPSLVTYTSFRRHRATTTQSSSWQTTFCQEEECLDTGKIWSSSFKKATTTTGCVLSSSCEGEVWVDNNSARCSCELQILPAAFRWNTCNNGYAFLLFFHLHLHFPLHFTFASIFTFAFAFLFHLVDGSLQIFRCLPK